ncbi:MAG: penicillin-binding protein 2 [Lachnospiraceae bacterium]|nr:penicillin-binding protein 2 [Lachnospiraceae bacterium]
MKNKKPENKQESVQKPEKSVRNREFAVITYCFIGLFLCLMGYFVYFQIEKSEEFINNSYNSRQETFAEQIIRGEIHSADGEILAKTETDSEGNETRVYPYGNMFSHIVGYSTKQYGQSGVESWANFNLLRSNAFFLEKTVDDLTNQKSIGDNVITTLNYDLQSIAYQSLGEYDGAVIVMEPATGKILASVSKPDFNPNTVEANWEAIVADKEGESALLNRATQGLYPPGSTFKIITALAYIQQNPTDYTAYTYSCTGSIQKNESKLNCFSGEVHGNVNLETSFSESCNTSFANIGLNMNLKDFTQTGEALLFNQPLPVSKLEVSKSRFSLDKNASISEIMETSIGQGKTLVTPLHMLMITSAIANDGLLMEPYVIDHTENYEGAAVKTYEPVSYGELMTIEEAQVLQSYMQKVVEEGTGSKLKGMSYQAAGKTGSAEYGTNKGDSHAWFVGYAHRDDKEDIAIAVIVEGAGIGSAHAVPIAKSIFDMYYRY